MNRAEDDGDRVPALFQAELENGLAVLEMFVCVFSRPSSGRSRDGNADGKKREQNRKREAQFYKSIVPPALSQPQAISPASKTRRRD